MLLLHLIATVTIHIIILPQNLLYCSIVTGFDHIQQSPFCLFLFADLKMESSLRSHFLLFSSSSSPIPSLVQRAFAPPRNLYHAMCFA
jgi:hypothetical protein